MIIITKAFEYQGDATGKNLGSTIFLDDAATVTIEGEKIFKVVQFFIKLEFKFAANSRLLKAPLLMTLRLRLDRQLQVNWMQLEAGMARSKLNLPTTPTLRKRLMRLFSEKITTSRCRGQSVLLVHLLKKLIGK